MEKAVSIARKRTAPILYSEEAVSANSMHKTGIPVYRQALIKDISSRFFHDADFRRELRDVGDIWVADKEVRCSGPFRISEDGAFSPIGAEKLRLLPEGQQSIHYGGLGPVAVRCDEYYGKLLLSVSGEKRPTRIAKVAYVKDEGVHAMLGNTVRTVTIPLEELLAVRKAFDMAAPYITRTPQIGECHVLFEAVRKLLRDRT